MTKEQKKWAKIRAPHIRLNQLVFDFTNNHSDASWSASQQQNTRKMISAEEAKIKCLIDPLDLVLLANEGKIRSKLIETADIFPRRIRLYDFEDVESYVKNGQLTGHCQVEKTFEGYEVVVVEEWDETDFEIEAWSAEEAEEIAFSQVENQILWHVRRTVINNAFNDSRKASYDVTMCKFANHTWSGIASSAEDAKKKAILRAAENKYDGSSLRVVSVTENFLEERH